MLLLTFPSLRLSVIVLLIHDLNTFELKEVPDGKEVSEASKLSGFDKNSITEISKK